MIGIDTNILVHHFVHDNKEQAEKASDFFWSLSIVNQGYLSLVSLVETYWVMNRGYKIPKQVILQHFDELLEAKEIAFQNPEIVNYALEASKRGADFADALIACSCKAGGCSKTVTFDQQAAKSLGMELL
jgi:predicted nucleic-acid-binding protein